MATDLSRTPRGRGAGHLAALCAGGLLAASAAALAVSIAPSLRSRYLPWITGRSLGIASYLCLTALVGLGVVLRHPWRGRLGIHPASLLRAHAVLGVSTVVLVLAHASVLASDRYAGVGWAGALVPGLSHYRTGAVAVGTVALVLLLLVAGTARLAGRRGTRHWLAYHRLAGAAFGLVWLHGVLAGTDTAALRPLYVATATGLLALVTTRALGHGPEEAGVAREVHAGAPATDIATEPDAPRALEDAP